jgi:hypothetical protein
MLIPTDRMDNTVIWHLLFNEDGSHISYNDLRIRNLARPSVESLRLSELENLRHIVGWCSNMKNYAGKRLIRAQHSREADITFQGRLTLITKLLGPVLRDHTRVAFLKKS